MFGRHKLMRDGAQARAVVTEAKRTGGKVGEGGMTPIQYDLELKVHFDDGATGVASCHVSRQGRGVSPVQQQHDPEGRGEERKGEVQRPAQAQAGLDERIAVGPVPERRSRRRAVAYITGTQRAPAACRAR
jgi:hypothetical protein